MVDEEREDAGYREQVGLQLRDVRRARRLSLHDVEVASGKEFKASVLGAYERGERAISVPRLQRLARFYGVPVDQLLPPLEQSGDGAPVASPIDLDRRNEPGLTIDLVRLEGMSDQEMAMLGRFIAMVRRQRGESRSTALTIRRDDLLALAAMLGSDPDTLRDRIGSLTAASPR